MAIDIVSFPINSMAIFHSFLYVYQRVFITVIIRHLLWLGSPWIFPAQHPGSCRTPMTSEAATQLFEPSALGPGRTFDPLKSAWAKKEVGISWNRTWNIMGFFMGI